MSRMLMIVAAALALTACDAASTPTRPLTPVAANHDEFDPPADAVPDANCRSGWSVANGRCL